MQSVLSGHDTLALMPTGGGKSLCYQVPVMARAGLGLIISPLIALMKDQVEGLRKKGITSFAIYSGMSRNDVIQTLRIAAESNCKFLYVSPERLETKLFREWLPGLHINLIAVDEAHCISQWGYDFRPSYLKIATLREELTGVPVLALTASATVDVQEDICKHLTPLPPHLKERGLGGEGKRESWNIFRQSFERPNLSYSVFHVESKINKILEIIEKVNGTSIVYCRSRKRTREISERLQMHGIRSDFYHAGLSSEERNRVQEDWINNTLRVIVCTNAFGMGIDKPDVRTVVHADVPDCLENYYQEAGRAGRDRKRSYAVLLYDDKDLEQLEEMAAARFPTEAEIRQVYQATANYLQVAAGTGEGQYYDFDIGDFLKKFKLPSQQLIYSLKALEQEGWLSFNEQVFAPAMAGFTTSKDMLYVFEKENPALDLLIKTMLRGYEGIFDQLVAISEKNLAYLAKRDINEIKKQLEQLQGAGIIEYRPQKDSPQLYYLRNRIPVGDLSINMVQYNLRKKQFEKRVKIMQQFVKDRSTCRSIIIGHYFGDEKIGACGICDTCLNKKNSELDKEEFERLRGQVVMHLEEKPLSIKELSQKMTGVKKEKTWKLLEFLQSEKMITLRDNGLVELIKS